MPVHRGPGSLQILLRQPLGYVCWRCTRAGFPGAQLSLLHTATQSRNLQTNSTSSALTTPFRKQLKDAAKARKKEPKHSGEPDRAKRWELTVGIEVHAELNTARKLFSRAATSVNAVPNEHVALFDAAFPGTQPHFQTDTLVPALRAALALGCEPQARSTFDRKHYFYHDQPAGYQITQYYEPFAKNGHITLYPHDFPAGRAPSSAPITVGIKQVQLEQDTAKTTFEPPSTHLIDLNRVSHPLIEIITLPHIHDPATAAACVRKMQAVLKAVNAVTAGIEMGGLRADVNVSVRERADSGVVLGENSYAGVTGLGQRTELKNLASFKAVEDAIVAERDRQIQMLESGGVVEGETRGWTLGEKTTKRLRGKEGEVDYRYMPDPDIAPCGSARLEVIKHLRDTLPMLVDDWVKKLVEQPYGLTHKDAGTLLVLDDADRLDYYLEVVELVRSAVADEGQLLAHAGRVTGNWVLMELGGLFKNEPWSTTRVPPEHLASIVTHVLRKQITGRTAKRVLAMMFDGDARPVARIVADDGLLLRPLARAEYEALARALVAEKPDLVAAVVAKGHARKLQWFLGQMMARAPDGCAEPAVAERVLHDVLGLSPRRAS